VLSQKLTTMTLVEISNRQGRVPVTILHLRERVHIGNFSELETIARQAYQDGTRNLVIDLSRTDSMTSIGLRALVVIHKILAGSDNGKHLKIAGATTVIREIMQVTGISQFIDVHDSVEEAVSSF
jgi:anti-anti-sigma factor